jgi:predicted NBD/HSP70 family sugar kinase
MTRFKLLSLLKQRNAATVLRALYFEHIDSRARIVAATGIAPSTVSSVIAQLAREGLVEFLEDGPVVSAVGRPPQPIRLNPTALYLIGVEINLFQSRVTLVGIDGAVHARREINFNARANPAQALATFLDATEELVARQGVDPDAILGIGVSFRGLVDREKGIVNRTTSLPEWNHVNIVAPFRERFAWPVFAENNANAMVLGEARFGVGRGKKNILGLIVEEGIGSGIIINGRLYLGLHSAAGELGHMIIIPSGPTCHCGNRGCLRTLASESAIEANAIRILKGGVTTLLGQHPNAEALRISTQDVVDAATQGDTVCIRIILEATRHLGISLISLVNILSPEMIIFNGGPLTRYVPFLEEIERTIREGIYSGKLGTPELAISNLKENAVCVGAACSVLDRLLGATLPSY